jgi:hypothetical protein
VTTGARADRDRRLARRSAFSVRRAAADVDGDHTRPSRAWSRLMTMRVPAIFLTMLTAAAACGGDPPPGRTYFERTIQPILTQSCAGNTSGCHRTNPDDPYQFAAGNLDVTSFEAIQKRRDTLVPFGSYPVPLLLVKAVGAGQLQMAYGDEFRDVMVPHAGGGIFQVGSEAYLTLLSWTENGATENGLRPPSPRARGR